MPIEIMLVPIVGLGTREDPFKPKYVDTPGVVSWCHIKYGWTDETICGYTADQTVLDTFNTATDVQLLATESSIDVPLTNPQANIIKNKFEEYFIPKETVNAGDTPRELLRSAIGVFLFSQRMQGIYGESFPENIQGRALTLNTRWSDCPVDFQNQMLAVFADHGWPPPTISTQTRLGDLMTTISTNYEGVEFNLGDIVI